MSDMINGIGHKGIVPNEMFPSEVSKEVIMHGFSCNLTPNIAMANAEFEGALTCGKNVRWLTTNVTNDSLLQSTQGNEEPETTHIQMCYEEAEICGKNDFEIKLSADQLRKLECEDLDNVYFDEVHGVINRTLDQSWDMSHLAYLIHMASSENTGNNALDGMFNFGSPDNPIIISKTDRSLQGDILMNLFNDMNTAMGEQAGECTEGDAALILPNVVAGSAMNMFTDLNTCCGDDNVRINGHLPKTIYGFDTYKTTKKVMSTIHKGKRIYYIILADKKAHGFVSDVYNFKWWEAKRDWYLVGSEVHGSYILKPEHVFIAVVAFE